MKIAGLFTNKCPNCQNGKVYQKANLASFGSVRMNDECPACHMSFRKDPGFYWGSMYASYGLAMVEAVTAYLICRLLGFEKYDWANLAVIVGAIIVCSPFNFRMARMIWLYIFPD